jgi:hypothetical protein
MVVIYDLELFPYRSTFLPFSLTSISLNLKDTFKNPSTFKMFSTLPALIVTSIGLIAQANIAKATQTLDLSGVTLNGISYGGTGCPQGSFVKLQDSKVNGYEFSTQF